MKRIAIFASGSGSNFQAIVDTVEGGGLRLEVGLLVCDEPGAPVIERARQHSIPTFVFSAKNYKDKGAFESVILEELEKARIDYIVLAGYMRLIGPTLLSAFPGRIINIHPSLLPQFPGKDAIGQALSAGAAVSGVTIHFVDEGMDTGPIIAQKEIIIAYNETKDSLQEKIHSVEHQFYPEILQKLMGDEV